MDVAWVKCDLRLDAGLGRYWYATLHTSWVDASIEKQKQQLPSLLFIPRQGKLRNPASQVFRMIMGNKTKSLILPFNCNSAECIFACACIGKGISKQIVKNQAKIISHVNNKQGRTMMKNKSRWTEKLSVVYSL